METENSNIENQRHSLIDELADLYLEVPPSDPLEGNIAGEVADLIYDTEITSVLVDKVSTTTNSVVAEKAEILFHHIPQLEGKQIIPEYQTRDYPIPSVFDFETLSKAPWVNMVHAWTKVLNELNTVAAMQRGETPISAKVIASIAHTLYSFTTNANGDRFNRTDEDFLAGNKYVETIRRESGAKFVNASRFICYEELMYILNLVKKSHSL